MTMNQRERHAEGKVPYELFDSREGVLDKRIGRSNFKSLAEYEADGDGKFDRGASVPYGEYTTDEKDALTVAARTIYGSLLEDNADGLRSLEDEQFVQATDYLRTLATTKAQAQYFYLFSKNGNDIDMNTQELIKMNRDEK